MKKRYFIFNWTILFLLSLLFGLFMTRLVLPRQLDDLSPEIPCDESLIKKSDVLYVIPNFNDSPINEDLKWCQKILSYEKELALHGFRHTYEEFGRESREEDLISGIKIFEECFGFKPERFKPPQIALSNENKKVIRKYLDLDLSLNQILHKVYHCNDSGWPSNRFNDWV